MSRKGQITVTSGLEWDIMLALLHKLKQDGRLRDYLFVCAGCYFGLRAKDLLKLKWSEVADREYFFVIESKTRKTRKIDINPTVKDALEYVRGQLIKNGKFNPDGFLFANRWGDAIKICYANQQLHWIFERYKIKAQNPSTHTLRKTFAKRVWEMDNRSERSLVYLSEILNHSSTSVTRRYIGITQQIITDVYMKL
jgi:integrase